MSHTIVFEKSHAILHLAPTLELLAERCGQPGAMHWLQYFLEKTREKRRTPLLVLFLREAESEYGLELTNLEAAAMFYEYRILGFRTGAIATADAVGFNSVIARAPDRQRVARKAVQVLIDRGANTVLATYERTVDTLNAPLFVGRLKGTVATRQRDIRRSLPLQSTLDATLAQMGKSTRGNLRYYRRRLDKTVGLEFIPDALPHLNSELLRKMNRNCLNPVSSSELNRRMRVASDLNRSYLCGLRTIGGRWLSLAGGCRQAGTTVLHWQMNTAGWEAHSITTVMRAYLLELEIARGAKEWLIYGGTPHTMSHAFALQDIEDFVFRRNDLHSALIHWAARWIVQRSRSTSHTNFLASTLADDNLVWKPCEVHRSPSAASVRPSRQS